MNDTQRYEGKPLLRLLELYTLQAIDRLQSKEQQSLIEMTPQLRKTFNADGDWDEVIEAVMKFPPNMPQLTRNTWAKHKAYAAQENISLEPQAFAESFVDENFCNG